MSLHCVKRCLHLADENTKAVCALSGCLQLVWFTASTSCTRNDQAGRMQSRHSLSHYKAKSKQAMMCHNHPGLWFNWLETWKLTPYLNALSAKRRLYLLTCLQSNHHSKLYHRLRRLDSSGILEPEAPVDYCCPPLVEVVTVETTRKHVLRSSREEFLEF